MKDHIVCIIIICPRFVMELNMCFEIFLHDGRVIQVWQSDNYPEEFCHSFSETWGFSLELRHHYQEEGIRQSPNGGEFGQRKRVHVPIIGDKKKVFYCLEAFLCLTDLMRWICQVACQYRSHSGNVDSHNKWRNCFCEYCCWEVSILFSQSSRSS